MNGVPEALLNGAIVGGFLTAAVWLVLRITPRGVLNAATRYVLWWCTLLVVVSLPAIYLPRPARPAAVRAIAQHPVNFAPAVRSTPLPVAISRPVAIPPPRTRKLPEFPQFPIRIPEAGWLRPVLIAWSAASFLLFLRLLASFIFLSRACASAQDVPGRLGPIARGATGRNVRLAGSTSISIPVAVGPWRPAILIPWNLLDTLSDEELKQIVLHEASHLARRDDYTLMAQRALEAAFALHPVVRWIARRIDLEREVACDDRVIAITGRPRSYATCLTRVVECSGGVRSSLAAASAADDRSHLSRRVDMLLDKQRHTGTRLLKARLSALLALMIGMVWLAGRSPGFVAFATPLVKTLQQAPRRLLSGQALVPHAVEQPEGSVPMLEARVVEDSSGEPLASAEVRVHKAGMREMAADLDTDRTGHASARGLEPGEYSLEISKPNFVPAMLKVQLPATGMTVRLVRYGVVSGQVTDQSGQAAPASIHAPYGRAIGGTRVALLAKSQQGALHFVREYTLEEGGQYRIFDLTPGQYAIGVWYDGLKEGSGVQLYPDSAHPRLFTVSGGEEYEHIDFLISAQATFQMSGKVDGVKKGEIYAVALELPEQPALPIAQTLTEEDGSFRFEKIPAGSYEVLVGGPSRGYGAHDTVLGPNPRFGRISVAVGQNVEGLTVPLSGGRSFKVTLGGRGSSTPPPGCSGNAAVTVTPLDPWGLYFNTGVTTQASFGKESEVRNLAPGRFRVDAGGLPEGCYQVNQPVADLNSDTAGPITLELATAGSIRGVLRGAARPADYSVVLLDAEGSADAATFLAHPDGEGRFVFDSLHPGRYRIAAQESRWVADVSKMPEIEVAAGTPTEMELPVGARAGRQ